MRLRTRRSFWSISAAFVALYASGAAAEETPPEAKAAISLLDFGGSTASALYDVVESRNLSNPSGDPYISLANDVQATILEGRAASKLAAAPFHLASDSLAVAAVVDPEPATKVVAAVSAYGIKKAGDYAASAIYQNAE